MEAGMKRRRSARQRINKSAYVEADDTDDDLDFDDYLDSAKRPKIIPGTRTRQGTRTTTSESPAVSSPEPQQRRRRRSKRNHSHAVSKNTTKLLPRRRNDAKRSSRVKKTRSSGFVIGSDGKIPPWQTLPYEILKDIFSYAAIQNPRNWLLRTARGVCRGFAEPALTALYSSPTIQSSYQLASLHNVVRLPTEKSFLDYKVKVKRLELSVHGFVERKDETKTFELASLVADLPVLEEVIVTSLQDQPPYRRHTLPRWRYPTSLFDSLDLNKRKLKSWRWNYLFIREARKELFPQMQEFMTTVHLRPSFQTLEHLEIFDHPTFGRLAGDQAKEVELANIIGLLPNLKSLELVSCDMISTTFMENLPRTLTRLRIANSPGLTSDTVHGYLVKDGSCSLKQLVLDHNVRLDLAFLMGLATTCPHLESFKMDLHYYSQHHTVNDADARYDYLLGADETPSWPASLQEVELIHLQKWSSEGAKNLFQSLIDSAGNLPHLRRLVLHAHINIGWRDRVAFREQWISRLRRVFLDTREPDVHLASFKAYRKWLKTEWIERGDHAGTARSATLSRHSRITEIESSDGEDEHKSDSEPLSKRRSKRIAETEAAASLRQSGSASVTTLGSPTDGSTTDHWRDTPESHVHGRCDVVDIRIDNQRPREEQYNESHFLDSEQSGDEDWEEGGEMPDDGYAW